MPSLSCLRWAGAMEPGFILERHERHAITTFRCGSCGFLESYAAAE